MKQRTLTRIKIGKALGIDNITPQMIMYIGNPPKWALKHLLNDISSEYNILEEWNN